MTATTPAIQLGTIVRLTGSDYAGQDGTVLSYRETDAGLLLRISFDAGIISAYANDVTIVEQLTERQRAA